MQGESSDQSRDVGSVCVLFCVRLLNSTIYLIKPLDLKLQSAQYCSRECQRVHWKVHKTNCEAVANRANSQQIMTMAHTADEDSRQKWRCV